MTETEVKLANVDTHDSEFTRGFSAGYATAMAQHGTPFVQRLPVNHLSIVRVALRDTTCRLTALAMEPRNRWCVQFVHLRCDFPDGTI